MFKSASDGGGAKDGWRITAIHHLRLVLFRFLLEIMQSYLLNNTPILFGVNSSLIFHLDTSRAKHQDTSRNKLAFVLWKLHYPLPRSGRDQSNV
ncbi:hypothetical protein E2C01_077059 [Portunus trituberculatus]|uniref:Uncharacterized protein n=1 Tax=Portunus trituberculatus TaxID=210409 RepID=A0A5B7IJD1_PORTR|nr:hypothetical protein [Portunus trituberculatus]